MSRPADEGAAGRSSSGSKHRSWLRRAVDRPASEESVEPMDVATECAHFLAGTYAAYLEGLREPVPAWARVNAITHADVGSLVALAAALATGARSTSGTPWEVANGHMAAEVLRVAAAEGLTPQEVQLELLVPLELTLASSEQRSGPRTTATAGQVVAAVTATLHRHPSSPVTPPRDR